MRYLLKFGNIKNYLILNKAKGDLPMNQLFDISWAVKRKNTNK